MQPGTSAKDSFAALCFDFTGDTPVEISAIKSGGGDRRYFRLKLRDDSTMVGAVCSDMVESEAFVNLTEIFLRHEVSVPEIYCVSEDYRYYLMQDLGSFSLFDSINSIDIESLVKLTLKKLVAMQLVTTTAWEKAVMAKAFSGRQVMWDLNYFKYEFAKPAGALFDEEKLEDDFEELVRALTNTPDCLWGFMMRDCQSRNVMLTPAPVFIDYQAGRYGPGIYDAVSLLWQAKAGFSPEFRNKMMTYYADEFQNRYDSTTSEAKHAILTLTSLFALFRTLQVLGAYGFRGLVEKKAHFIESIPNALQNLSKLISEGTLADYPELEKLCNQLCSDSRFQKTESDGKLHIKVFSFSYKKGYPEDLTGNGGGFMFDCRGLHNPGRYEQYKSLTGRDKPVIDFLRESSTADSFAAGAADLVSETVECYLKRGFDSLQIGFGCTGGRHRSVYCAEFAAHELKRRYPDAVVYLIHREQDISEEIK